LNNKELPPIFGKAKVRENYKCKKIENEFFTVPPVLLINPWYSLIINREAGGGYK
jgi:hypothetical protein